MVAKKASTSKGRKLSVKKETIKNLDSGRKAKDVKGGQRPPVPRTYGSCDWSYGVGCHC